jgi:hypothetical protein
LLDAPPRSAELRFGKVRRDRLFVPIRRSALRFPQCCTGAVAWIRPACLFWQIFYLTELAVFAKNDKKVYYMAVS